MKSKLGLLKMGKMLFTAFLTIMLFFCCTKDVYAAIEPFYWPVPATTKWITYANHTGIDIQCGRGTDIYAAKAGTVVKVWNGCAHDSAMCGCNDGFGNGVVIRHDDGTWTEYAHMQLDSIVVTNKSWVEKGAYLGKSASSGSSKGPHLHFGIRQGSGTSYGNFWSCKVLNADPNGGEVTYTYDNNATAPQLQFVNITVTDVTETTAFVRSEITNAVASNYSKVGLLWGTTQDVTQKVEFNVLNKLTFVSVAFDGSEGPVLEKGTTYYYRFYVLGKDGQYTYSDLGSFTTAGDKTPPVISNLEVKDVDFNGYTVVCTVTDNVGVARVCFPTWTEANGQDDLDSDWYNTKTATNVSGNTYSYRVNILDHNGERGNYATHVYCYDASGNYCIGDTIAFVPQPVTGIQLSNTSFSLNKGASKKLSATVQPGNASNTAVEWKSDNTSVATVANDGTVTAVGSGKATITVTAKDGSGISARCVVTVADELKITTQPASASVDEGTDVVFKVVATGNNLTYQWQFKNASATYWTDSTMTGAKTNSITVKATTARNGYQYRCVVKDASGNKATSNAAKLTVAKAINISAQPASASVAEGAYATFKVTATGNNLTYQWQFKNALSDYWSNSSMAGSNTNSITVQGTTARNGYQYRCIVKDGNGNKLTSNAAILTVIQGTQSVKITSQPASKVVTTNANATFKVTATGSNLTYQWQFKSALSNYWSNSSMAGSNSNSITVKGTTARNGYQYRCVVKDGNGNKVTSNAATLTVVQGTQSVTITGQPASQTVAAGSSATFKVTASGSGLTYQWQFKSTANNYWADSTMAGSKTNSITVQGTAARNGYQYRCVVKDSNGNKVTSNAAKLTVN